MFPFSNPLQLDNGLKVDVDQALKHVPAMLTPERLQKIKTVLEQRTFNCSVVLEDIYDRGNASAVMRSAEAMGFAQVHMIELGEKFKESQRTTAGADKWIELKKWKSTKDCAAQLKKEGRQIVATHLDATSVPIGTVDFSKPTALVLGNEKTGISKEMAEAADYRVIIPMQGFVQSYNISVAAAISLYHIYQDRVRRLGQQGDLTVDQKKILSLVYMLRTQPSAEDVLKEVLK